MQRGHKSIIISIISLIDFLISNCPHRGEITMLQSRITSLSEELDEKNTRITQLHSELSEANDKHRRAISEVNNQSELVV